MSDYHPGEDGTDRPTPQPSQTEQASSPQPIAQADDDTVSLLDLIGVLARRWKLIFFATFFAGVGVVLFSLYTLRLPPDSPNNPLPNVYKPEALILLQNSSSSGGIGSMLASTDLGALAGLAGISAGGGGEASAALAQELLRQNEIVDTIVDEFELLKVFADSEAPNTAARRSIREALETEFDASSGIMTVSLTHIDPVFATEVLQRMVELLEFRFKALTRSDAQAKADAYRRQIATLEDDLQQARRNLIAFQQRYGIIDPETQATSAVESLAALKSQLYSLELEREALLDYQDPDSPQVVRKQREIDGLKELINELESGFSTFSGETIPLNQFGALQVQYLDLRRELTLKESLYTSFQSELLAAEVEAQDTSRIFQLIQPPEVPEVKDSPSRGMISIIVTITAFFLSVFLAFVLEYFARAKEDPLEAQKIEAIKNQFRPKRKRR